MTFLIVGANGCLARTLARSARAHGRVFGMARRRRFEGQGAFESVLAYPLKVEDLTHALEQTEADIVFHAAGSASVEGSFLEPNRCFESSVTTFANLLEAIRRMARKPIVVFPSSAAVYGNPSETPIRVSTPKNPISPYGFHKGIGETLAREYAECFGIRSLVLRYFSLFGPDQRRLLVWELFESALRTGRVTLRGTGEEMRDYLSLDVAGNATMDAIKAFQEETDRFRVLQVCSGTSYRTREVGKAVLDLVCPGTELQMLGNVQKGKPDRWQADASEIATLSSEVRNFDGTEALRATVMQWIDEDSTPRL